MAEIAHHWFEGRDLPRALVASIKAGEAAARRVRSSSRSDRTNGRWSCGTSPDPEAISGLDRIELVAPPTSASCRVSSACRPASVLGSRSSNGRRSDPGCAPVRTAGRALDVGRPRSGARGVPHRSRASCPTHRPRTGHVSSPATPRCSCSGAVSRVAADRLQVHDIAVAAGQRQIEGHAATTLGVDLVYATPTGGETAIR